MEPIFRANVRVGPIDVGECQNGGRRVVDAEEGASYRGMRLHAENAFQQIRPDRVVEETRSARAFVERL